MHRSNPDIIEVDSARMVANGETIWHAGVTVFLTENVLPEYLTIVSHDDPEFSLIIESWQEEE